MSSQFTQVIGKTTDVTSEV